MTALDAARLATVISPLRRVLLTAARDAEHLPEIPDAQIEIIRALPRDTASSPGELAGRLGLSRPTVSNLLTAMEANGLVERRPRPGDRRHVEVLATAAATLTHEDREALTAALPALERLRDALSRPSPKDIR
jgi:DNA-binding MarR family transcriptional regulator